MLPEELPTAVSIPSMSWFQTTNFASLAKTALKEAQKTIDKALDIRDENSAATSPNQAGQDVDSVALTESEIESESNTADQDVESSTENVVILEEPESNNGELEDPISSIVSLTDSRQVLGDDVEEEEEAKWSTIEVETCETSHSRNSSISTIPDTNSNSSPERDVVHSQRNVNINGQIVDVVHCISDKSISSPLSPKNIVDDEESNTEANSAGIQESSADHQSHSSSSFEHVISNSATTLKDVECAQNDVSSSPINSPSPPAIPPLGCNKIVTKIKTNASSASSSDIEVIPLDPEDHQLPISKILQEAETQTDETLAVSSHNKPEKSKPSKSEEKMVAQLEEKLREKDKEIKQLMEEGEKLSKKQFDISTVVKKLRVKEREQDSNIKSVKAELAEKCVELDRIMKIFVNKERIEQEQNEQISRLNSDHRKLELEIERLKSELEDAVENCNTMKISMENTSLDLLEKENIILATQHNAGELDRLTKEKSELLNRSETLQKEVDHLRSVVNETQKESSQRELRLKSQLTAMTGKCHKLESELSDVSSEIADATMPLSLEIEKLQQELKNNQAAADKRESSLVAKISDLEHKLKVAMDREGSLRQIEQSTEITIRSLESKMDEVEEENKHLKSSMREVKLNNDSALKSLESRLEESLAEIEKLKQSNQSLQSDLRNEKNEKKKVQQLLDQQMMRASSQSNSNPNLVVATSNGGYYDPPTPTNIATSTSSTMTSASQKGHRTSGENSPSNQSVLSEVSYLDEVFDSSGGQNLRSMTPKSFFESFSSANVIENLHAQLRLREGELIQFQEESSKNEKIRKSLNEEIAQLTIQNQELLLQTEKLTELHARFDELEKNYNAVLQMYGEKVEEAEELRLDLQDVKKMYKDQINELMMQNQS